MFKKKTKRISAALIAVAMLIMSTVTAFADTKLEIGDPVRYDPNYGWVSERITANGGIAYCMDPSLHVSSGTYSDVTTTTNQDYIKPLYYGYGGEGWNEGGIKSVMDQAKSAHWLSASGSDLYYLLTHRVVAYLSGSSYWNEPDLPMDWQKAVKEVATAIQKLPNVDGYVANIVNTGSTTQRVVYLTNKVYLLQGKQKGNRTNLS